MKNLIVIVLFFLGACSTKTDAGSVYLLQSMQNNVIDSYMLGAERLEMIKELVSDKSREDNFRSRIFDLYDYFRMADSVSDVLISSIDSIKVDMLIQMGQKEAILGNRDNEFNKIVSIELSKINYQGGTDILTNDRSHSIIEKFKHFRKELCEIIEDSQFSDDSRPPYFFKDPVITDFKDNKDYNRQFDKGLERSNVSQDDRESLRMIYRLLTIRDDEWRSMLTKKDKWTEVLTVLFTLQDQVLKARYNAFRVMGSRFCIAEYGFTHIVPIVNGPDIVYEGDTVILEVFYGALNIEKQPEIGISGNGKILKVKDGRSYVQMVIPKTKSFNAHGTITVRNMSGVPKTEKWFKQIKVLPSKIDN